MNASKSIHVFCFVMVMTLVTLPISALAAKPVCGDGTCNGKETAQSCEVDCGGGSGGGGDTGSTAPDPYNLARASFATKGDLYDEFTTKGGVFADGEDGGLCLPYDYWDWQEALLPEGVGLDCETFLNSSNVSGGGRWFLISNAAGSEEVLDVIERWLVVDFSDPSGPDPSDPDSPSPCYDLDNGSNGYSEKGIPIYRPFRDSQNQTVNQIKKNTEPCIDHLAIRLSADRILKPKASQQQLDFSIRWRPDPNASIYWPPWGYVSWINPLYLRDPDPSKGEQKWADIGCRVMSTRPAPDKPHDRDEAELLREIAPGQTDLLGTYFLPMEVCVKRASD